MIFTQIWFQNPLFRLDIPAEICQLLLHFFFNLLIFKDIVIYYIVIMLKFNTHVYGI